MVVEERLPLWRLLCNGLAVGRSLKHGRCREVVMERVYGEGLIVMERVK